MFDVSLLASRLDALEADNSIALDRVFDLLCSEFGIDADAHAEILGCRCPYGLVGYLSAGEIDD